MNNEISHSWVQAGEHGCVFSCWEIFKGIFSSGAGEVKRKNKKNLVLKEMINHLDPSFQALV